MRRGGDKNISGTNTASNSEGPSKTTSEAGGDSASDGGHDSKSKAAVTREEREARYREARLRIFGKVEESEISETPEPASEDISRSSSASGKKKNNAKKQRNNGDDDFEARSQFNPYYPSPVMAPGYGTDGVYYGPYQTMASPVTPMYASPYPQMVSSEGQPVYVWPNQGYAVDPSMQTYPSPNQVSYDLSNDFQRGMQSFQTAKQMPQPGNPTASPSMAPMQMQYQPPMGQTSQAGQSWTPPAQYDGTFQPNQRPQSSPAQHAQPIPYAYGQLPGPAYQNGRALSNQHPIPGSFNRQQFNPQSQAFVPGAIGNGNQFFMQQGQPAAYQPPMQAPTQPMFNPLPGRVTTSQPSGTYAPSPRQAPIPNPSTPQSASHPPQKLPATPSTNSTSNSTLPSQPPQQHPLPQPPNPDSTIAKWGTPPHLPPKPPPPATMQPQKWMETHQRQMQMQGFANSPALNAAAQGVARLAGANGLAGMPQGKSASSSTPGSASSR